MNNFLNLVLLILIFYQLRSLYISYRAPNIIPEEMPRVRKEAKGKIQIIDVRSKMQFNKDHIKGSRNIQFGNLYKQMDQLPKNKKIILVSQRGTQTGRAVEKLIKEGFDIVNLKGGYKAWTKYQKD